MKSAIYSRYSSDSQDATSISGQQANCEQLIDANGWRIVRRYTDEALSGSDDTRPGYLELLADSEAGRFDVIVVDETSRLTRSAGELPRLLEQLAFRDQFIVDCKGFDSRQETASLLASIYGGIDSLELRKIKDRTHRGLRERAKAGYSAGGKVYGYTTEAIDADDPGSKKRVLIVPEQADIVREIFARFADGESTKAIANDLNRRGIPSPGSTWARKQRRCRGWVHTALAGNARTFDGILRREQYTGTLVWNRTHWKKVPGTSKRKREVRPESEWVIVDAPELRIVDSETWDRVQARLAKPRRKVAKRKRPPGRQPRYLLSGLLVCGDCGANFIMQDARAYGCSSHTNGGRHLCGNAIRVKREVAENALLTNIKAELLSDDTIRYVRRAITDAMRKHERQSGSVTSLEIRLQTIEAKLERIADAIADMGISATLRQRLTDLEAEKRAVEAELQDARNRPVINVPDIIPGAIEKWRALVTDFESLADNPNATPRDVEAARDHLHALLGPVVLKPQDGVLWAHPSPNAKSLVETRLSDGLHINSHFRGSGGRI